MRFYTRQHKFYQAQKKSNPRDRSNLCVSKWKKYSAQSNRKRLPSFSIL